MAHFAATTTEETGNVRVSFAGSCDLAVSDEMRAALLAAVGRCGVVIVDLAEVDFLDSSGLHCLVAAHHEARGRSGQLYVENPAGAVAAVLELTGVATLLSPAAKRQD